MTQSYRFALVNYGDGQICLMWHAIPIRFNGFETPGKAESFCKY